MIVYMRAIYLIFQLFAYFQAKLDPCREKFAKMSEAWKAQHVHPNLLLHFRIVIYNFQFLMNTIRKEYINLYIYLRGAFASNIKWLVR